MVSLEKQLKICATYTCWSNVKIVSCLLTCQIVLHKLPIGIIVIIDTVVNKS